MRFVSERIGLVLANYHDRKHRYDNVSTIPKELFIKAMNKRPGIHRDFILSAMPPEVRAVVKEDIAERVQVNISALPERLHPRVGEVIEAITAFVAQNGRLAGEVGFISATDSSVFGDDNFRKRQLAWLMQDTGLIEVFSEMTRKGKMHNEHWRLSKKIDAVLQEIS